MAFPELAPHPMFSFFLFFFPQRGWKQNPERDIAQKPKTNSVSDQIVGPGQQGQMWLKGL